jgi:hypothetical protein
VHQVLGTDGGDLVLRDQRGLAPALPRLVGVAGEIGRAREAQNASKSACLVGAAIGGVALRQTSATAAATEAEAASPSAAAPTSAISIQRIRRRAAGAGRRRSGRWCAAGRRRWSPGAR